MWNSLALELNCTILEFDILVQVWTDQANFFFFFGEDLNRIFDLKKFGFYLKKRQNSQMFLILSSFSESHGH